MKEVVYNNDNLKEEDITKTVVRVKALLVNSDNEVLLGYSHDTYQFPGGHLEEGESLVDCLNREVEEETGMILDILDATPFFKIKHYNKDYPEVGTNSAYEIYYFVLKNNDSIDLNKVKYDEWEKEGNFQLLYVKLDDVERILTDSIPLNKINETIVEEMLEMFKAYKNNN